LIPLARSLNWQVRRSALEALNRTGSGLARTAFAVGLARIRQQRGPGIEVAFRQRGPLADPAVAAGKTDVQAAAAADAKLDALFTAKRFKGLPR
jgi:hypothetical protein